MLTQILPHSQLTEVTPGGVHCVFGQMCGMSPSYGLIRSSYPAPHTLCALPKPPVLLPSLCLSVASSRMSYSWNSWNWLSRAAVTKCHKVVLQHGLQAVSRLVLSREDLLQTSLPALPFPFASSHCLPSACLSLCLNVPLLSEYQSHGIRTHSSGLILTNGIYNVPVSKSGHSLKSWRLELHHRNFQRRQPNPQLLVC